MKCTSFIVLLLVLLGCERPQSSIKDLASQLRPGMTRGEVVRIMGEPEHIKVYTAPLTFTDADGKETKLRDVDEGLCYDRFEFKTDRPEFKLMEGVYFGVECQMWKGILVAIPWTTNPNESDKGK